MARSWHFSAFCHKIECSLQFLLIVAMTLKRFRNRLGRALLGIMCGRLRLGPRGSERLARLCAALLWRFQKRRRRIMLARMRDVLDPKLTDAELLQIQRDAFLSMGRLIAEFLQLAWMSPEQVCREMHYEGLEHVERAAATGKGILFITAHFGNWELLGARMAHERPDKNFYVVAQTQRDEELTRLVDRVRERQHMHVIARGNAARDVLRALREGHLVGILMDIDAKDNGIIVDFLGKPASTTTGPVAFALRTGAEVITAFDYRLPDGTHVGRILPPVEMTVTGDREVDMRENTIRLNDIISAQIRTRPDLWMWSPDRWRSTDPIGS